MNEHRKKLLNDRSSEDLSQLVNIDRFRYTNENLYTSR